LLAGQVALVDAREPAANVVAKVLVLFEGVARAAAVQLFGDELAEVVVVMSILTH
jgi:hypothetical protein